MERPRTALGLILLVALDPSECEAQAPPAPDLDPILQGAIAAGIMSEAHARDLDAFADGVVARVRSGELTEEQGDELVARTAIRDGEALNRARARRGRQ